MTDLTDPHPFVFACVNGFVCENGSNQAAREISIATRDYPSSTTRKTIETTTTKTDDNTETTITTTTPETTTKTDDNTETTITTTPETTTKTDDNTETTITTTPETKKASDDTETTTTTITTNPFRCETFIVNVFDAHDHLLYDFGASDQIRNVHRSHHSGFPRPVRDETEFLKYYETLDDNELYDVASYRGDCTLSEAQSKSIAFFRALLDRRNHPSNNNNNNNKIYIGVIRSFEYPFFQKFFSPKLFRDTFDIDIEFVVYDEDALAPYSVYSYEYPSDLFPPNHERYHRKFDGYPYPSKHGCTVTRAWYYLEKRNDPLYRQIRKDRYENRLQGGSSDTDESNPIDSETVRLLMDIHNYTKGYRTDGWCRPVSTQQPSGNDNDKDDEGKKEDRKTKEDEDIIKYNTYCQYNIVP